MLMPVVLAMVAWSHVPMPISEECPYRAESARSRAPLHILNVQSRTVNCLSWTHSIDFDTKSSDSSAHKRISRIPFAFFGVCRRQAHIAIEMDILLRRRSSNIDIDCRPFVCVQATQSYRLLCALHMRYLKPIRSHPAARNRTRLSIGSLCVNAFNKCTNSFIVFVFNLYFESYYFSSIFFLPLPVLRHWHRHSFATVYCLNNKTLAPLLLLLCSHSLAILRKCNRLSEIEISLRVHDSETDKIKFVMAEISCPSGSSSIIAISARERVRGWHKNGRRVAFNRLLHINTN